MFLKILSILSILSILDHSQQFTLVAVILDSPLNSKIFSSSSIKVRNIEVLEIYLVYTFFT